MAANIETEIRYCRTCSTTRRRKWLLVVQDGRHIEWEVQPAECRWPDYNSLIYREICWILAVASRQGHHRDGIRSKQVRGGVMMMILKWLAAAASSNAKYRDDIASFRKSETEAWHHSIRKCATPVGQRNQDSKFAI